MDEAASTTDEPSRRRGRAAADEASSRRVEPAARDDERGERRKFYVDGGTVEIAAHLVYELDPDGKQLRVVRFTDYTGREGPELCASPPTSCARSGPTAEQRAADHRGAR